MRLATEAGVCVELFTFRKDASNAIEALFFPVFPDCMEELKDGTVQTAHEEIFSAFIDGQGDVGCAGHGNEICVGLLHRLYSVCAYQIQAETKIDDSTYDKRLECRAFLLFSSVFEFERPIQGAVRIGFPEIDTVSKPVIIIFALRERFIVQKLFPDFVIAAVVTENKGSR